MFGLDYTNGPPIAALLAAKVAFVCRYTGYFAGYNLNAIETPQGKCLTPGEAKALGEASIAVVSNYEWYANRATESDVAGNWDAHTADRIHRACGGDASRPIYFSVDSDVDGSAAANYFKGVASVLGLARTGAYGSYRVIKYLLDNHLITWAWQTYAWSFDQQTQSTQWEPRAHIRQYENGANLAGADVDFNRAMKQDVGQWFAGKPMLLQEEPMTPLTLQDVKSYFTANTDGSWTRIDPKTAVPLLDSLNKPIVLKGAIKDDWCNHGKDALPDIGLPDGNETQVDAKNHPEVVDQQFERGMRRYDPHHVTDSPPGAGVVFGRHLEEFYSAEVKLQLAEEQLAATQKQLQAAQTASPDAGYKDAIKTIKGVVDPLTV